MTIDEAIEHSLEKGKECTKCGKEHLQLAEWLKELKVLRKENEGLKRKIRFLEELEIPNLKEEVWKYKR